MHIVLQLGNIVAISLRSFDFYRAVLTEEEVTLQDN